MIPTEFREGVSSSRDRIGSAIRNAAARTNVDFSYLFNQAKVESGLNPEAKARTSSASGLFQFIDQTWLGTVKKHGAAHGLEWAANAIRSNGGRHSVADPELRQAILDLREDPNAASSMAAEFARDNQDSLESSLGRPVESVDLYLAHFLGAGGASDFLRAHDANPDASAAALMPAAARANRNVFYDRDGAPKSFAEIRDRFAAKIGGSAPLPSIAPRLDGFSGGQMQLATNEFLPIRPAATAAASAMPANALTPQYAKLAYLMLAEMGA
ncbi:transglycosylase SLT domain-containing protein [Sphingoaurantiacus capsulatus]|uniref:Transglycosylase SLT domain-containing protein n=1 Tax=Sphingoaurantiacus capsulatus TaxID=1771310 RepID=A0ABV7XFT3_9SPHN